MTENAAQGTQSDARFPPGRPTFVVPTVEEAIALYRGLPEGHKGALICIGLDIADITRLRLSSSGVVVGPDGSVASHGSATPVEFVDSPNHPTVQAARAGRLEELLRRGRFTQGEAIAAWTGRPVKSRIGGKRTNNVYQVARQEVMSFLEDYAAKMNLVVRKAYHGREAVYIIGMPPKEGTH